MPHILIPDNLEKIGLNLLTQAEGVTIQAPAKMSRDEVLAVVGDADGMIIRSGTKANAELLQKAAKLKAIVRAGVGVDNVDLVKATELGIAVMNTPAGNTVATAEHTMALMLALARHIPKAQISMLEGQWERKAFMGTELRGKTLGIIGFGRVGQAVAKRSLAFEMNVIAYDPYVSKQVAQSLNVALLSLDELLARADYLTLHTIVTPETEHLIDAENIAKMKDGVRLINAARGTLVNEHDLAEAIKSGKITGAALDVYAEEPPQKDNPLIGLSGIIHTPHLGASTLEAQEAVAAEAAEIMLDALLRNEYRNVVNREVQVG
ncbi:MAG: phosphoglycerate dehydrogenase [Anaerolineae bacterium]|nr:MAG: phosphoglycerate dehydrogenase [Anaerolineae bacterium]